MQLGVDVGGTNTDAALIQHGKVLASVKTPTTADVSNGIVGAIRRVLDAVSAPRNAIETIVIGTTHFTNAFVERKGLNKVGIIRLCLPAASDLAPMSGWPPELRGCLGDSACLLPGGYEFDGREIAPFDETAVRAAARQTKAAGLPGIAISSVCSPINSSMERRAAEIVREELPDAAITLSSDIGRIGLVERENATIMNASMALLSKQVIGGIRDALVSLGLAAPFCLSQNDGTLMDADYAERFPVLTFASGPSNSIRGAAYLSGIRNGIVVDIGGTTTDVGALVKGYPRESTLPADIGGVRTNFRMPDVVSIGLGGGSLVTQAPELRIGPASVGFQLTEKARVFGGDTLTATDIVVAAGLKDIGDRSRVGSLKPMLIDAALARMNRMIEDVIDTVKISAGDVPVVLVGGGAIVVSGDLRGVNRVVVPEHAGEANAIGAAMAQVGSLIDRVYVHWSKERVQRLEEIGREAVQRVVEAGGDAGKAEIVEIEEVPLSYSGNDAARVRIKAVSERAAATARLQAKLVG